MAESFAIQKKRYLFIDLYRSAVIVLMLEGHIVRSLLKSELQQTALFGIHEFFHGLSAPAFLFGAGLTFIISTHKRWEEYHHWGSPLAKRAGRLLLIIGLGLAIHLPYFSIRKIIINGSLADYLQLFQCDVLHCIGFGLLLLHALIFFFKTEQRFYGLVLATTLIACFLTPFLWDIDFIDYLPPVFAQLLNGNHGSPFPLFPYVGFLFSGVLVSWEFLNATERNEEKKFMRRISLTGICLIAAGILLDVIPIRIYPTYNYWFTSPNYFFVRIGSLLILTAASWWAAYVWSLPGKIWTICGRESLLIYVLHLPLIYGSVINPTFDIRKIVGTNLGILDTTIVFIVFTCIVAGIALIWNYLKREYFNYYRLAQVMGAGIFLYVLFTRDN
jgi:uncharacterized membrane protein